MNWNRFEKYKSSAILICCSYLLMILLAACQQKQSISLKTYEEFAQNLATSINEGNPNYFNEHFDLTGMLDQVIADYETPEDFEMGFVEGVSSSLNVGQELVNSLGALGYYRLLRINNYTEQPVALFRLVSGSDINYHEVFLSPPTSNTIRITDFYPYIGGGGQPFSTTLKRLYINALADLEDGDSYLKNAPVEDRAFATYMPKIEEVVALASAEKMEEALQLTESLPNVLQRNKMTLMMRMNIANNVSDAAYQKVVQDFNTYHPNDPVSALMQLDFSFEKDSADLTLALIDSLNTKIGGDPYLKVLKAEVFKIKGDTEQAEQLLHQSIAEEPEGEEAYWTLLLLLIETNKYAEAVALFTPMQQQFDLDPATLISNEDRTALENVPEFQAWVAKQVK